MRWEIVHYVTSARIRNVPAIETCTNECNDKNAYKNEINIIQHFMLTGAKKSIVLIQRFTTLFTHKHYLTDHFN